MAPPTHPSTFFVNEREATLEAVGTTNIAVKFSLGNGKKKIAKVLKSYIT